jgi:8-oxo-dGTP pyrophosphatase MutT (NUDIX family)
MQQHEPLGATAALVLVVREGAPLIITRRDNHLVVREGAPLIITRRDSHLLGLPGGKVEPGEDPRDAAARELYEETGLIVSPKSLRELYRGCVDGEHVVTYLAPDPGEDPAFSLGEGVPLWGSWYALTSESGAFPEYNLRVQEAYQDTDPGAWIRAFGSGTLRRAKEEGMLWRSLYVEERTAFLYGYGFEMVPSSRVNFGQPLAEGDDPVTTAAGWHCRRLRRMHPEWSPGIRHACVEYPCGEKREGIVIVLSPSEREHWMPKSSVILAWMADESGKAVNPC